MFIAKAILTVLYWRDVPKERKVRSRKRGEQWLRGLRLRLDKNGLGSITGSSITEVVDE